MVHVLKNLFWNKSELVHMQSQNHIQELMTPVEGGGGGGGAENYYISLLLGKVHVQLLQKCAHQKKSPTIEKSGSASTLWVYNSISLPSPAQR